MIEHLARQVPISGKDLLLRLSGTPPVLLHPLAHVAHQPGRARLLGGVPLSPNTRDPAERRLRNVVEEMAIASGTATPPVYLMDGEAGINAFAAGFSPSASSTPNSRWRSR